MTGTYLMCREAHRQHMGEYGGSIVNIIADMFRGFPMMAHTGQNTDIVTCQNRSSNVFSNVGAARAGIDNLTKSLCVEWAGDGVRVFIGRLASL